MTVQSGLTLMNWAGERADGTQRLPRDPRLTKCPVSIPSVPVRLLARQPRRARCGIRRAVTAELYRLHYCSRLALPHFLALWDSVMELRFDVMVTTLGLSRRVR